MLNNHFVWVKAQTDQVMEFLYPLSFNLLGILAGSIIARGYNLVEQVPWGFMVFPGLLSLRGAIGGMFAGRLSTGLHLGTVNTSIWDNTEYSYSLFSAIVTLTLISGVTLSFMSLVFGLLVLNLGILELGHLIGVVLASLAGSIVFISPITFLVSVESFRRGLDPDVILYPVISTTADVAITLTYIFMIWLSFRLAGIVLIVLSILALIAVSFRLYLQFKEDRVYRETIREFLLTLVIVSVIVNVTGSGLESISKRIQRFPAVYASYPALIDTVGDVGSIIGSTLTTRLALGELELRKESLAYIMKEAVYPWAASAVLFIAYALISSAMYGLDSLVFLTIRFLIMNVFVISVIIVIVLVTAWATYRRGLDPDNFIIPIETSLADTITTFSLLLVLMI